MIVTMKRGATSTMDAAGRLVLPRAIRDEAQLEPGMPLSIVCRDGRVEIEPAPREVRVVKRGRLRVAVPIQEGSPLSNETVRATTSAVRNRRR
jgi:bifunctional DNA-binding transcriptional regulator/antitoxin component of YhaV-PrlF toxin-antitoxin module